MLGCWAVGLLGYWSVGLLGCWSVVLVDSSAFDSTESSWHNRFCNSAVLIAPWCKQGQL